MRLTARTGQPGHSVLRAGAAVLLVLGLAAPVFGQARYHRALDPAVFPVPRVLVPNVEFWRDIFSKYTSSQTVIHDNLDLDVVFAVVDVSDLERAGASPFAIERARRDRVNDAVEKYQNVLRRLAGRHGAPASAADLARVEALYAKSARHSKDFAAAVDRVRGQGGLKDIFGAAIETSGMFMPGIERTLEKYGLPREIRCLPFVESMFNYRARSKVGASGVWQFTADTGRRYLQIDSAVDARHDVWLAADAAARLLAGHYAQVGSWPVALTAYNHGIAGMTRAVRQLGTNDIGVIATRYKSPSMGFASRNFYAEFVAAVTVFADREQLFPDVTPLPAVTFDEYTPGQYVSLLDLAALTGTDVDTLTELNPALSSDVIGGTMLVPPSYPLRVPTGSRATFARAFDRLPSSRKRDRQLATTYRVARGDTLGAIARRFGTSVAALQRSNGITRANRLRVGQVLEVGAGRGDWSPLVWKPSVAAQAGETIVHVVRAGETLYQIASRYGSSIAALAAANDLVSPDRIAIGMSLVIPATTASQ